MLASEQEIRELEESSVEIAGTLDALRQELAVLELAFAEQREALDGPLVALQDSIACQEAQRLTALSAIQGGQAQAAETAFRKSELLFILKSDDEALAQRQDRIR